MSVTCAADHSRLIQYISL